MSEKMIRFPRCRNSGLECEYMHKADQETAWEMYRRLLDKYDYKFEQKCIDAGEQFTCRPGCDYFEPDIRKLPEEIAIKIMKEIEKELSHE